MVIQIFGDLLYYPDSGCLEEFPSPELLKHRIILSTKPPKEYREGESSSPEAKDLQEEELSAKDTSGHTTESEASAKVNISGFFFPFTPVNDAGFVGKILSIKFICFSVSYSKILAPFEAYLMF